MMTSDFSLRALCPKPGRIILVASCFLLACAYCFADTPALALPPDYGGPFYFYSNSLGVTVGWSFHVSTPVTVTSLGFFDRDSDGLLSNHDVGIYDSAGHLLVSATVPAGTGAPIRNSYRFVSMSPTPLPVGDYVAAAFIGTSQVPLDTWPATAWYTTFAPDISYHQAPVWVWPVSSLTFPTVVNSTFEPGHFAANFEIADAPPPNPDADGDGVFDALDLCPNSLLAPTVVIDGCNSSVPNLLFSTGCTISDLIAKAAASAGNHGHFVSAVANLTNQLAKSGAISGSQKGAIQGCAAKSSIP